MLCCPGENHIKQKNMFLMFLFSKFQNLPADFPYYPIIIYTHMYTRHDSIDADRKTRVKYPVHKAYARISNMDRTLKFSNRRWETTSSHSAAQRYLIRKKPNYHTDVWKKRKRQFDRITL